jgi:NAD(P)-dependent dehydrogenase (short-subunit alcohol dehydrogenase family)
MNMGAKRVLITGSSGGLGTATMTALVESGCEVIGIDRRPGDAPFADNTIVADVTNEMQVPEAVAAAIARLGGLDVLINNAGVLEIQDPGASPLAGTREHIEVNLLAPWRITAAALPALMESHGRVFRVLSVALRFGLHPAYCASKQARGRLFRRASMAWRPHPVTCVYPIHRDCDPRKGGATGAVGGPRVRLGMGGRTPELEEPLDAAA